MNSSFNFKLLGNCNVLPLLDKLNNLTEQDWQKHSHRQETFWAHKDTNTIEVVWDKDSLITGKQGKIHDYFYILDISSFLNQIKTSYINAYGNGDIIRILITRLKEKSIISPHIDTGDSLLNVKRTHIPLLTNPGTFFIVGDEAIQMQQGEIWEINNSGKSHAVINNTDKPRIHLIIDYLPK
jgi:hypothetical protein